MFDAMLADWVVETSPTTGTGPYSLGGVPAGTSYFTFRQRIGNGDPVAFYFVRSASRVKWELNVSNWAGAALCTLTYGTPDTLARNVVRSTNGDAAVSWVSGDLPLRIYMAPYSALWEAIVSGMLADAIGDLPWLRHGEWFRDNYPSTDWRTKYLYDGTGSGIPLGKYQTAARKFIPDPGAINFPPKYISGLTISNNGTDPTNDIDIAAGAAADSTGVYPLILAAALTKRLDASWAVGTGNGGLDTGSIADADYFVHLIARSDTGVVDALFSLSLGSPTLPANYDYFRPIGWIKRASSAILTFTTREITGGGIEYLWKGPTLDVGISTLTTARQLLVVKVPLGFTVDALLDVRAFDSAEASYARLCSPDETDAAPSSSAAPLVNIGAASNVFYFGSEIVTTDTSGQVAARAAAGTLQSLNLQTRGFRWRR